MWGVGLYEDEKDTLMKVKDLFWEKEDYHKDKNHIPLRLLTFLITTEVVNLLKPKQTGTPSE